MCLIQDLEQLILHQRAKVHLHHRLAALRHYPPRLQFAMTTPHMERKARLLMAEKHFAEPAGALRAPYFDIGPWPVQGRQIHSEGTLSMYGLDDVLAARGAVRVCCRECVAGYGREVPVGGEAVENGKVVLGHCDFQLGRDRSLHIPLVSGSSAHKWSLTGWNMISSSADWCLAAES